jgi:NarL family two-component system response regulator YdfI
MIRVQIKASSAVVRAGLESLLQNHPSLHIIKEAFDDAGGSERATTGESAQTNSQPDVILAELESRGDETASEVLIAAANGTPVVLLVPGAGTEWADALRQGVKAVLPSSATGPQIAAATEAAAAGLLVVHPSEIDALFHPRDVSEPRETLPEALTPREIEVLRLLAEGLANKEVAARLALSEHTIKFHVASIMGKLGANSRTEAVMLGIRHGLVLI